MMAMDSSVLGCGSDDWSVDSDYAFQEFGEDALRQSEHSQSTASPERAHRNAGVPTSSMEMPSGMVCTSEDQTQEEVVRAQTQAADGAQMPSDLEERQSLEHEELRESKEDATAAKSDEQPICLSEARLFGDPGSSTDSTHILKLEQRMFLKVLCPRLLTDVLALLMCVDPRINLAGPSAPVLRTCFFGLMLSGRANDTQAFSSLIRRGQRFRNILG